MLLFVVVHTKTIAKNFVKHKHKWVSRKRRNRRSERDRGREKIFLSITRLHLVKWRSIFFCAAPCQILCGKKRKRTKENETTTRHEATDKTKTSVLNCYKFEAQQHSNITQTKHPQNTKRGWMNAFFKQWVHVQIPSS